MPKTIRNEFDKKLTYENLMKAHLLSRKGKGLPIGNYTSQIFANIYLNELDQFIKQKLEVKYYFRYLNDVTLMVQTKICKECLHIFFFMIK